MNKPIPDSVKTERQRALYQRANDLRRAIKDIVTQIAEMRTESARLIHDEKLTPEVVANVTLTQRHLEDASFRLGHVLMHTDGGASVYDRSTAASVPGGTEVPIRPDTVAELQPERRDG